MRTALAACAVAAAALVGCGSTAGEEAAGPTSPASATVPSGESDPADALAAVVEQDFPDPDVLLVGDTYHAYATQPRDGSVNVQVATSTDLRTWTVEVMDPLPELPAWATSGRTWAPEVTAVGDAFVMYLTAHSVDPDRQCIGVARSTAPTGPFRPVGDEPLVCPAARGGAIDAASFLDRDGARYLLWKNDGNCCGKDTWLHLQPLSRDGLRLTGPAVRLVKQTEAWEGDLVEAPSLVRRGSTYVLFYSANSYGGGEYATGYATATDVEGPYRKADDPFLTTEGTGITGPGGADVFADTEGRTRIAFHGWDEAVVSRYMYVADLGWRGDEPTFGR